MAAPTRRAATFTLIASAASAATYNLPPMGWNSWFAYDQWLNETGMRSNADQLVNLGLRDMGFKYLNLDGGWQGGRYANGTAYENFTSFPSGMKALADYVHSKGLLLGSYTDRGSRTCDGRVGSLGYEQQDADLYASWPADYVKEDSCGGNMSHAGALDQFSKMQNAIAATGQPMFFSLCGWLKWYPLAGQFGIGQSWRVGPDALAWDNVLMNIDAAADAAGWTGPGRFVDVDEIMGPSRKRPINPTQTRTQFSLITVIGSPLLLSFDLTGLTASDPDVAMFLNPEMIAIHQDPHPNGPIYKKLRGGYVSIDKISPYTRLPCNASDLTVQWRFMPTLNSTNGYIQSANSPGWCLLAGPAWSATSNDVQQIFLSECGGSACSDPTCKNQQFSLNLDGTITSVLWPENSIAAGPYLTLDPIANSIFLEERLQGDGILNNSASQLWSFDNKTGLLSSQADDTCVGGAPRDTQNVWYKQLADGSIALMLINFGSEAQTVTCDASCFADAGFPNASQSFAVRDVWTRTDNGTTTAGQGFAAALQPGGASVILRLTPAA